MVVYPTIRLISQKDDLHAQKTKINYNFRKRYISKGQIKKKKTFNLYMQQLISIIEIIIFNLSNYYMSMH